MERSGTLVSHAGSSSQFRWWVDTSRDLCDVDALAANTICADHRVSIAVWRGGRSLRIFLALTDANRCTPGGIGHYLALEFAERGEDSVRLDSLRLLSYL